MEEEMVVGGEGVEAEEQAPFARFLKVFEGTVPDPIVANDGSALMVLPYLEAIACGLAVVMDVVSKRVEIPYDTSAGRSRLYPIIQRWLHAGLLFKYRMPELAAKIFMTEMGKAPEYAWDKDSEPEFLTDIYAKPAADFFIAALQSVEPERQRLKAFVQKQREAVLRVHGRSVPYLEPGSWTGAQFLVSALSLGGELIGDEEGLILGPSILEVEEEQIIPHLVAARAKLICGMLKLELLQSLAIDITTIPREAFPAPQYPLTIEGHWVRTQILLAALQSETREFLNAQQFGAGLKLVLHISPLALSMLAIERIMARCQSPEVLTSEHRAELEVLITVQVARVLELARETDRQSVAPAFFVALSRELTPDEQEAVRQDVRQPSFWKTSRDDQLDAVFVLAQEETGFVIDALGTLSSAHLKIAVRRLLAAEAVPDSVVHAIGQAGWFPLSLELFGRHREALDPECRLSLVRAFLLQGSADVDAVGLARIICRMDDQTNQVRKILTTPEFRRPFTVIFGKAVLEGSSAFSGRDVGRLRKLLGAELWPLFILAVERLWREQRLPKRLESFLERLKIKPKILKGWRTAYPEQTVTNWLNQRPSSRPPAPSVS